MPQSLSAVLIHLVFSTKNRERFILPTVEAELHPYLATIFREHDSPSLVVGGAADHIHALFVLGRTVTIAEVVERSEDRLIQMAQDERSRVQRFPLAKRVWRVFNWSIDCHRSEALHPWPKGTSPPSNV